MPEYIIFVIFHSYVYLHSICVLVNLIAFYFDLVTFCSSVCQPLYLNKCLVPQVGSSV